MDPSASLRPLSQLVTVVSLSLNPLLNAAVLATGAQGLSPPCSRHRHQVHEKLLPAPSSVLPPLQLLDPRQALAEVHPGSKGAVKSNQKGPGVSDPPFLASQIHSWTSSGEGSKRMQKGCV